jgi:serine/threonine protein kinase
MMETVPSGTILNGRYRVERVLGSGGFGHVYQAVDLATKQQYAIKEYLVTGSSGQEQLRHEASVLNRLHHPNLPAFHASFSERGRYYVVLNYIEGNDLTDIIRTAARRNEVVPLARIMEWILAVCDAVHFLHSQRPPFIHRDIKPDNIRIMPNGTAILVDLGNAKAIADGARTLLFIRHQGTPGYAPQEQYPGGKGTDARSDVYALGGTLFFALTGHEPPSVSTRNQALQQGQPDFPSLQDELAKNPPETGSQAEPPRQFRLGVTKPGRPAPRHSRHLAQLGTLPPELLNQLNRIIQKATAMRPEDRYPSVAEFASDLRKVMGALPPSTPPARPLDPNRTQPDLPNLYETMQAAKENTDTEIADIKTAPIAPPSSAAQTTCPRCNAPLTQQSAFCPYCGTPLGKGPSSSANSHNANALDQTRKAKPRVVSVQPLQQPVTSAPGPISYATPGSSSISSRRSVPSSVRNIAQAVIQPPPSQNTSATGNASTGVQASNRLFGFEVGPVLLVTMAVVLVLLLILMIVLFNIWSHRAGHTVDVHQGLHWYALSAPVLSAP